MKPKIFSLIWIFECLEDQDSFFTKKMFGGLAVYFNGRMVMLLCESPGDTEWRGATYPFEIWNGLLLPTEREFHQSLQKDFPNLVNHPVLPKWLYLPMSDPNFEETALQVANQIEKKDERFGILPKEKSKPKKKQSKKKPARPTKAHKKSPKKAVLL